MSTLDKINRVSKHLQKPTIVGLAALSIGCATSGGSSISQEQWDVAQILEAHNRCAPSNQYKDCLARYETTPADVDYAKEYNNQARLNSTVSAIHENRKNNNQQPERPTQEEAQQSAQQNEEVTNQQRPVQLKRPVIKVPKSAYVCVPDINDKDYSFHILSPDDEITHKTITGLDRDAVSPIISLETEEALQFTEKGDKWGYIFAAAIDTERGVCTMDTEKTGPVEYTIRKTIFNGKALRYGVSRVDAVITGSSAAKEALNNLKSKIPVLNKLGL